MADVLVSGNCTLAGEVADRTNFAMLSALVVHLCGATVGTGIMAIFQSSKNIHRGEKLWVESWISTERSTVLQTSQTET